MTDWVGFPQTDPFFTDLSGLTLQSGVGVGPAGRLVKDEYTVGGGTAAAVTGVGASSGMEVDGEMNQTIQHHPPTQPPAANNPQQPQQPFMPGHSTQNPGIFAIGSFFLPPILHKFSFYFLQIPLLFFFAF